MGREDRQLFMSNRLKNIYPVAFKVFFVLFLEKKIPTTVFVPCPRFFLTLSNTTLTRFLSALPSQDSSLASEPSPSSPTLEHYPSPVLSPREICFTRSICFFQFMTGFSFQYNWAQNIHLFSMQDSVSTFCSFIKFRILSLTGCISLFSLIFSAVYRPTFFILFLGKLDPQQLICTQVLWQVTGLQPYSSYTFR